MFGRFRSRCAKIRKCQSSGDRGGYNLVGASTATCHFVPALGFVAKLKGIANSTKRYACDEDEQKR